MFVCPIWTAKPLKGTLMGKVRNKVLGSYPSSRDCVKRNKSKYGAKLNMVDHAVEVFLYTLNH